MIDRRSLIRNSSAAGFGALALAAVSSGSELAYGAAEGHGGWDGFPANLTAAERKHLKIFDELDFEIFTGQKWDRLHESHARNIRAHWPDGHFTDGIDKHIADLAALFVWAPDTRIEEHPFRLANGQLTAVTGNMLGTFTKPMPDGKGGFIQPTGKAYSLPMATVGIWNKRNTMDEEYLFWDNQTFFTQIGLG
ncbi:nuclear transport factor 2 family protein [Kribbella sp. NPDC051718]|uniref:nuclear transport factor 2 family protein n=1 Tax=Kribbella sp. NPDC051718 TaxID=3155168 RepID=UPI003423106B